MVEEGSYHQVLKNSMDEYIHLVYRVTRSFPREELYGVTSQLRRSSLSVILNYIEGYARFKTKVHKNFLETAYGSLQESKYLLEFSLREGFFSRDDFEVANRHAERIGAILFGILKRI